MSKKKSKQALLNSLQRQASSLKLNADLLESEHKRLSVQHAVLSDCCSLLHSLRAGQVHPGWLSVKESWLPEELPLLRELSGSSSHTTSSSSFEQQLQLQQQDWTVTTSSTPSLPWLYALGHSPPAADEDNELWAAGEPTQHNSPARMRMRQPGPQADLTPPGDYLGALRYALSRPPYEGAAAMTLEGFRDYYEAVCRELALNLALAVQQGPPEEEVCSCGEHPLAALQRLELQHAHLICTLLLLHPDDLVNQIRVADLNTLQLTVDPDKAWQRTHRLVEQLDITPDQQVTLIAGSTLFKRLIDRTQQERQQLTAQQGEAAGMRLATGRAIDLDSQQDAAQRLNILLKKERLLVTMASLFTAGSLSVVQLAKFAVLSWPWVPTLGIVGAVLEDRVSKQQQAQPPE